MYNEKWNVKMMEELKEEYFRLLKIDQYRELLQDLKKPFRGVDSSVLEKLK